MLKILLARAHQGLFTYVSSSGSSGGPGGAAGGAFGTGLGGGAFGKGGATRLGGALGAGVSSAPHLTHFVAVTGFIAPHMGHLISFLPTVGGLKHIFFLLLTGY